MAFFIYLILWLKRSETCFAISGIGGLTGGGNGSDIGNGTVGTGYGAGGGGGAMKYSAPHGTGAAGKAGIVIVRYTSATNLATGGTITTVGGDKVHTFTANGTFTVL